MHRTWFGKLNREQMLTLGVRKDLSRFSPYIYTLPEFSITSMYLCIMCISFKFKKSYNHKKAISLCLGGPV